MKKLLALVLAGAMALSMVACGSKTESTGGNEGDAKLKVNLVCTALGDKSFNDSADAGLKALAADGIIEYKAREYGNDNSVVPQELLEASEAYDVVVCNNLGFGMATAWLAEHAAEYPEVTYFIYDEPEQVVDAENVILLAYKANESDYLAGVVAASESESGVIGFVGGQETNVILDFLVGYIQGAQSVNPDIKVLVSYVGAYNDPTTGGEQGLDMLGKGADVLHGVAGSSGNGALEKAAQAGKLAIGVDSDQYATMKDTQAETANAIITSALKNVGDSLVTVISELAEGKLVKEGDRRWFGGEYIGIAENEHFEELASDTTKANVEKAKAGLEDGSIVVKSAYSMTAEEINAMVNSAQ